MPFDLGYEPSAARLARPGYDGTSLQEVSARFPTESACFAHVAETRLGPNFRCEKCGLISPWYRRTGAKYIQHSCGAVISPLAGTLFHGTKLPLRLWFYALLLFANSQDGVDGRFLERHLGITYLAAFRMAQRIRWHLAELERAAPLATAGQEIEVRVETLHHVRSGSNSRNVAHVMFASFAGRIDCEVFSASRRHIALAAINKMVPGFGQLRTTSYRTGLLLSAYGTRRSRAAYNPCYFLENPDEMDAITGFLSYFLWPFYTHHKHLSRTHLWLYLKEFQFRYNRRYNSAQTYWDMVGAFPQLGGGRTNLEKPDPSVTG